MHRVKCFAVLLLPVLSSGCLTAKVVDAIQEAGSGSGPSRSYRVDAQRLEAAVQTADGKFHLSTRYSDGSLQHLVFTPWPRARRRGARPQQVPQLRRVDTPLPKGMTVVVTNDWQQAPWAGVCFAQQGKTLLLRRGAPRFQPVARFPQLMRKELSPRQGNLGRQIAYGFMLPLALIGDAIIVGGYAGAIFVSAGGLAAFVK